MRPCDSPLSVLAKSWSAPSDARRLTYAAAAVFLLVLDCFPLFHHALRVPHFALGEDMRMPADQFRGHLLQDLVEVETPGFVCDFRVHDGQQDQVAEFFAQVCVVPGTDGAGDFVCFLDQRRQQGFVRLFAVPRTPAGRAELRDNLTEFLERIRVNGHDSFKS